MKDRKERLQSKTALAKKQSFSERNTHSVKRNFTSKLFNKKLSKTARGCNSTVNRRYKAPVRHRPNSPTYCRNHFSFSDNHSKVLADDLNEYLLDSEDDIHVNDENLELGCKREKTVEVNGIHTNGNNLKLCSSFCNLDTRLKHFPIVNSCLDKCAIVILTDIHKDMKTDQLKMNTNDSQDAQSKVTKMKPSNSKSPSRPNIVKPVTLSSDLQTVRTTYVKPCDKDTLSDCSKSSTTAKASSVKDVSKGKSVTDSTSSLKKESPMTRGVSLDEHVTPLKKGKEKTRPMAKKELTDKVETNFPKKKGGKSKKTEESPSLNNEDIDSSVDGGVEVTPSKDDKKPVKTPRGRKKNAANVTPPVEEELRDKKGSKKSVGKSRNVSESPSPRRKPSPKKSPEKASPKSMKRKKVNAQNVENDAKKSLGDNDNAESVSGDSNKVKASARKTSKSPVKKREKTDSPTKINSVKESKDNVNEKKSPKRKRKDSTTNSAEKKQIKDSPGDSPEPTKSPRKNKSVSPKKVKNTDSKGATAMSRKLDFDDEMSKVIYQRSRLSFPPDFEYKYTSSIQTTRPADLGDLISKVNNAMKENKNNKELAELFGETEEPVSDSDDKTVSPESSVLSTSADSDKTILDFDIQNNPATQEETNGNLIKDSDKTESNNIDENKSGSLCENSVESKKDEEILVSEHQIKSKDDEVAVEKDITGKPSVLMEDESCIENEDPINSKKENVVENELEMVGDILEKEQSNHSETVSVFELYGLTLRRKNSQPSVDKVPAEESTDGGCEENAIDSPPLKKTTMNVDNANEEAVNDSVVVLSDSESNTVEAKKDDAVIVLSDEEDEGVDRTGYESLKETYEEKKVKPKFTTVNNIVEPKPLDILSRVEKAEAKKESAFSCDELEMYLNVHKQNSDFSYVSANTNDIEHGDRKEKLCKAEVKEYMKKATPDLDEIDNCVFVSFSCEQALKAHIALEKKLDWLTEAQLKKLSQLQHMKERQNDSGSKRITDVKSSDEQKLNFRGIPMRMMKYQKMLKQELEDILLGRQKSSEKSPLKHPAKTTDITKIKGWKSKFQNQEELQEATGINISDSGKVHWKTEERLVKNLDPEEIKDIGLDLKKKRRKLVNYSNRRKNNLGIKLDDNNAEPMDYKYELDEYAITEHDVYNEDDDKPPPEKIPYKFKYLSQHKYGARKLFVKRMKLDAEDERILQKLGTQKMRSDEGNQCSLKPKTQKSQGFTLSKVTHCMAVAAVSAFDKKLLTKAKNMAKAEMSRLKKKGLKDVTHTVAEADEVDTKVNDHYDDVEDISYEENDEYAGVQIKKEPVDIVPEEIVPKRGRLRTKSRRQSSTSKSPGSVPNNDNNEDIEGEKLIKSEDRKVERASSETCPEPGCRYGCICHLCKLPDSGEERETEHRPQCDKEYCRLGCICDSIDTTTTEKQHCKKPGCMIECKCPPKQPKPDIPRERDHGKRKKKGRISRKKKQSLDKSELENSDKEDNINEDGEWEPPSKRRKGTGYSKRFTNLPKRETTYRLAKNLDAVSRKAMDVYATSEMYAEQKVRRRRSDQGWVDDWMDKKRQPESRLNEFTGVLEISDEEESYPAEFVSCARTLLPYQGPYKQRQIIEEPVIKKKDVPHLNKRKGGPSGKRVNPKEEVIELDSDTDNNSSRKDSGQSDLPSTSSDVHQKKPPQTLTEKMGLVNLIRIEKEVTPSMETCRWKTQMVCLKAKKKSDDKSQSSHAEIKLLEIMSNCNWEIDRTNMLSKISHIISKDSGFDYPRCQRVGWGAYVLEFLPKADIPALIPPELKSKLPEHIFSIRIKVTKDQSSTSTGEPMPKDRQLTTEERKRHIMKWQKKLIDKIKFAERLRNLIIAEEQNGVKNSKFSVSREGIEKALKKYKTQLWKAYTGSSNLTLQQLKQALQAAKSNADAKSAENESKKADSKKGPTRPNLLSTATKARIQSNQGVTVVGSNTSRNSQSQKFINLANLNPSSVSMPFSSGTPTSFGNIVIHQAGVSIASPLTSTGSAHTLGSAATGVVSTKTSSAHGSIVTATSAQPMKGRAAKLLDKIPRPIETEPLMADLSKAIYLQPAKSVSGPGSAGSLSSVESSRGQPGGVLEDVVLMPLDKNVNPNNLPPGIKLAVLQQVPSRNETVSSGPVSLLPSVMNQSLKMKTCSTSVNGQNFRVGSPIMSPMVISSLASVRPHSPSSMLGNKITATSASSVTSLVGQGVMPCLTAQTSTSTPVTNLFPLKNISNINPAVPSNVVSSVTSTATSTLCSPSIYPIQFANQSVIANSSTSSEIHVVMPPRDMIGLPKVSSVPFKIYPAASSVGGKPLQFLVPVSMPFSNSMGDACVTLQSILPAPPNTFVNTAAKSASGTGDTKPVPGLEKQDTTADKKKRKSRKKKSAKGDGKEVGQPNNVSEGMDEELPNKSENKKHRKALANLDVVSEKVDQLPCQIESKDSSSLPPSDAATESEVVDRSVENENVKSNDNDHDVEQNILNIRIEDVKSIRDENVEGCSAACDQNPPIKCVKTESSEELGVEMMHHSDLANGKRASPDLLDFIDIEQTMKLMDEIENEPGIKNDHGVNGTVDDAIPIGDSEESDVDIMTCDLLESSGTGKRKARQSASDEDDQNKKFKTDELNNSKTGSCGAPRRTARTSREKSRRNQLRCLFETLEQVVFKYNTEMQSMQGSIPKHLILQEAYGLAQALKQKNELLQECLEDAKHCKEVLKSQLVQQTREFVDMGVPEPIIRNFLKSVQGTVFLENKKKSRKVTYEQSLSEDNDSALDFKPLTKWKFKTYEHYDSEAGTSGNHSSSGEMMTTDKVICSKDLQASVELVTSEMDEILEETAKEKTPFPSLRNDTKVTGSDYLSDINASQETLVKQVSQGSDDPPLSEMTYIASDMAVDRSVCGQDDNVVDSDDDDIQSTTGGAMYDYENESVRSEHSNDVGDNDLSNTDLVSNKIE